MLKQGMTPAAIISAKEQNVSFTKLAGIQKLIAICGP
jgi:hypothetical protein